VARARGHKVSRAQLARWHRAGLLPQPRQRSLGKGHGTQSIYPPGTGTQLLALCALRARERRLRYIAWGLWWQGYAIPMRGVRMILNEVTLPWKRHRRTLVEPGGDLTERAWDLIDESRTGRLQDTRVRRARKRIGRERFPTLVRIALEVLAGTFSAQDSAAITATEEDVNDDAIVEKGLGLDRARTDRIGDAKPWLQQGTTQILATASRLFRRHPPDEVIAKATDEALLEARDLMRLLSAFLGTLRNASRALEPILGRGAFGFGPVAATVGDMSKPSVQAQLLVAWLVLRAGGVKADPDTLTGAMQSWSQSGEPDFRALDHLRAEVPAAASVLTTKKMAAALRSLNTREQYLAQLREFGEQHREELNAFFRAHPEYAQLGTSSAPTSEEQK
jgi:hypothetical protein